MERKMLEEMGLDKDQVNTIMSDYGKSLNGLKEQVDTLKTERDSFKSQVDESNKQLDDLKDQITDNEKAKSTIEELQSKLADSEQRIVAVKKSNAINNALKDAHVRDNKAIMPFLDTEAITYNDDGLSGLSKQLEVLKQEKSFLFDTPQKQPEGIQATAGKVSKTSDNPEPPVDISKMGYAELLRLKQEHPIAYKRAMDSLNK